MPNLPRIVKFTLALGIVAYFLATQGEKIFPSQDSLNVRAYGDLAVAFESAPLFDESNFMPGDSVTKWVQVKNNGTEDRLVAVKAHNITGSEPDPILPEVLELVITKNATELYRDSLQNFFDLNTLDLSNLAHGDQTIYYFTVSFDPEADNDYQGRQVIFDLTFGYEAEGLVINEVYYQVDQNHGSEAPKDSWQIIAQNFGNGPGSVNNIWINIEENCSLVQKNSGKVNNIFNFNLGTGGNSGGSVNSGSISVIVDVMNKLNKNIAKWWCRGWAQNDEWVEIYNPTDKKVSLKNWSLTDNSGFETVIHSSRKISPHGFALISKSADTWRYWDEPKHTLKISLGRQIGDGLDNGGDRLLLKNPFGDATDAVGWGSDTFVWNPAVPNAPLGASLERQSPGFDTDLPEDFVPRLPSTPGN